MLDPDIKNNRAADNWSVEKHLSRHVRGVLQSNSLVGRFDMSTLAQIDTFSSLRNTTGLIYQTSMLRQGTRRSAQLQRLALIFTAREVITQLRPLSIEHVKLISVDDF